MIPAFSSTLINRAGDCASSTPLIIRCIKGSMKLCKNSQTLPFSHTQLVRYPIMYSQKCVLYSMLVLGLINTKMYLGYVELTIGLPCCYVFISMLLNAVSSEVCLRLGSLHFCSNSHERFIKQGSFNMKRQLKSAVTISIRKYAASMRYKISYTY